MLPLLSNMLLSLYWGGRRTARSPHTLGARAAVFGTALRVWSEVAEARGLEHADPDGLGLKLEGAIHGVGCELSLLEDGAGFRTRLRVMLPAEAAARMRLAPSRTAWARAVRLLGRALKTDDAEFDGALTVAGDAAAGMLATLDAPTRSALLAVCQREPHVSWEAREVLLEMEGAELGHEALLDLIDALVRPPPTAKVTPYR